MRDGTPVEAERTPVMGVYPAKNGRWSYLHCKLPQPPRCHAERAGCRRRQGGCSTRSGPVGCPGTGGGDYRRQGSWRNGPFHGGMGPASSMCRGRLPALTGNREGRRQPTAAPSGRFQTAVGDQSTGSDSCAGWADLRSDIGGARRGRDENQWPPPSLQPRRRSWTPATANCPLTWTFGRAVT